MAHRPAGTSPGNDLRAVCEPRPTESQSPGDILRNNATVDTGGYPSRIAGHTTECGAVLAGTRPISSESLANINLCQSPPPTIYNRSPVDRDIAVAYPVDTHLSAHVESVTDVSWSFICSHRATVIPGNSGCSVSTPPLVLLSPDSRCQR
ncbi:hypothetical protein K0M31_017185 [Melipona bicolor]|uniref:Uncharacterized protein n=1 Tax=Melipona bicolor TaxID=60889 RepID=A0AA40G4L4_9HYME|nr:hypothetical protein K0M31_017185 [Melipona bicolor]